MWVLLDLFIYTYKNAGSTRFINYSYDLLSLFYHTLNEECLVTVSFHIYSHVHPIYYCICIFVSRKKNTWGKKGVKSWKFKKENVALWKLAMILTSFFPFQTELNHFKSIKFDLNWVWTELNHFDFGSNWNRTEPNCFNTNLVRAS